MPKQNYCTDCEHCIIKIPDTPILNECALTTSNYANRDLHEMCIAVNRDGLCKNFKAHNWDQGLKELN